MFLEPEEGVCVDEVLVQPVCIQIIRHLTIKMDSDLCTSLRSFTFHLCNTIRWRMEAEVFE